MEVRLLLAEAHRLLTERRRARARGLVMLVAYAAATAACALVRGPVFARVSTTILAVVAFAIAMRELRTVREATARLHGIALALALTRTRGSA